MQTPTPTRLARRIALTLLAALAIATLAACGGGDVSDDDEQPGPPAPQSPCVANPKLCI